MTRRAFLLIESSNSKQETRHKRDINEFACRQTEIRLVQQSLSIYPSNSHQHIDIFQKNTHIQSASFLRARRSYFLVFFFISKYIRRHLPIDYMIGDEKLGRLCSTFIAKECDNGRNKCAHDLIKSSTITCIRNNINMDLSPCNSLVFRCK